MKRILLIISTIILLTLSIIGVGYASHSYYVKTSSNSVIRSEAHLVSSYTLYIETENGYEITQSVPASGYILNTTATTCTNGGNVTYNNDSIVINSDYVTHCNVYLNAKISTITLDGNGATAPGTTSVAIKYNQSIITPSTITPARKEYTVSGFTLGASATGASVSSSSTLTSSAILNGYYSAASAGIKVLTSDANVSLVVPASGYVQKGNGKWIRKDNITLYAQFGELSSVTLPTITKTGYTCGWAENASSTSIDYASGANITPSNNLTLYGVCSANELTFENQTLNSGVYGIAYTSNAFTTASNGSGNYTYTIKSGAPDGATINSANRQITFTNSTNAGTYNIVVTATDNASGATKDATMKIVINKIDAVCPTLTPYEGEYDGQSHTITVTGGSGGTIQYGCRPSNDWDNNPYMRKNVSDGCSNIYVQVLGDQNHNTVSCGSASITITKATPTMDLYTAMRTNRDYLITPGSIVKEFEYGSGITNRVEHTIYARPSVDGKITATGTSYLNVSPTSTTTITSGNDFAPVTTTVADYSADTQTITITFTPSSSNYNTITSTVKYNIAKGICSCVISSISDNLIYPSSPTGSVEYTCSGEGEMYVSSSNTNVITASSIGENSATLTAHSVGYSNINVGRRESEKYIGCSVASSQRVNVIPTSYQVTTNIKENNANATTTGYSVSLSTSSTEDTATKTIASAGASVTFDDVAPGTYYIWAGKSSSNKTTRLYSGKSVEVSNGNVSETINYYGLTLNMDSGISTVSNGGVNTTAEVLYLYNALDPQRIPISATVKSGYEWKNWTYIESTQLETIAVNVKEQEIQMSAGRTIEKASTNFKASIIAFATDTDTISYSSVPNGVVTEYYVTTSSTAPSIAAASSGSTFALDSWTTATNTGNLTLSEGQVYYIYAKDSGNKLSSNHASIAVRKVERSQATGTTLTTKYNSSGGSEYTTSPIYVLNGSNIYVTGSAQDGYGQFSLKKNNTSITAGSTVQITEDTLFSTSAVKMNYQVGSAYYETLASAYTTGCTTNTCTIKVIADNTDGSTLAVDSDKTITIDTNGKTITRTKKISNNGNLIIDGSGTIQTDSAITLFSNNADSSFTIPSTSTVSIINNNEGSNLAALNGKGTITIEGNATLKAAGHYVISQSADAGNITITNGTFEGLHGFRTYGQTINISNANVTVGSSFFIRNSANNIINLTNNTFSSTNNSTIQNEFDGVINVYSGTYSGNTQTLYNKSTGTINIYGGTIISATSAPAYNAAAGGTINVGTNDSTVSITSPVLQGVYGYRGVEGSTFNFYDGILKGTTAGKHSSSVISDTPEGYAYVTGTETIDGTLYNTGYLSNRFTLTINPNGGTYNNKTTNTTVTQNYGTSYSLPVPTRTGYIFNGWTLSNGGILDVLDDTSVSANPKTINYNTSTSTLPSVYNNKGNGTVTRSMVADATAPGGYSLQIVTNGEASPNAGGISVSARDTTPSLIEVIDVTAKVPVGYTLVLAGVGNTYTGVGSAYTHNGAAGTGDWETYRFVTYKGSAGGFVTTFYIDVNGSDNTSVTWNISSIERKTYTLDNYKAKYTFANGNGTLTAAWKKAGVKVTFNPNGGTFDTTYVKSANGYNSASATSTFRIYSYQEDYSTAPASTNYNFTPDSRVISKSGSTFLGWYTAATGGTKIFETDGTLVASLSGYSDANKKWINYTDNVTLYAHWRDPMAGIPDDDITVTYSETDQEVYTFNITGGSGDYLVALNRNDYTDVYISNNKLYLRGTTASTGSGFIKRLISITDNETGESHVGEVRITINKAPNPMVVNTNQTSTAEYNFYLGDYTVELEEPQNAVGNVTIAETTDFCNENTYPFECSLNSSGIGTKSLQFTVTAAGNENYESKTETVYYTLNIIPASVTFDYNMSDNFTKGTTFGTGIKFNPSNDMHIHTVVSGTELGTRYSIFNSYDGINIGTIHAEINTEGKLRVCYSRNQGMVNAYYSDVIPNLGNGDIIVDFYWDASTSTFVAEAKSAVSNESVSVTHALSLVGYNENDILVGAGDYRETTTFEAITVKELIITIGYRTGVTTCDHFPCAQTSIVGVGVGSRPNNSFDGWYTEKVGGIKGSWGDYSKFYAHWDDTKIIGVEQRDLTIPYSQTDKLVSAIYSTNNNTTPSNLTYSLSVNNEYFYIEDDNLYMKANTPLGEYMVPVVVYLGSQNKEIDMKVSVVQSPNSCTLTGPTTITSESNIQYTVSCEGDGRISLYSGQSRIIETVTNNSTFTLNSSQFTTSSANLYAVQFASTNYEKTASNILEVTITGNKYVVTADSNGGTIPTTTGWADRCTPFVYNGSEYDRLNYTWYSNSSCTTLQAKNNMQGGNTYYRFNGIAKEYNADDTYGTLPTATKSGSSFAGWYNEKLAFTHGTFTASASDAVNLGRTYMYTDKISIHLEAYMADWTNYGTGNQRLISCTESGGWNIQVGTNKEIEFLMYINGAYKTIDSKISGKTKWSELSSGWHTFDMVYSGSRFTAYIDGSSAGYVTASGNIGYHASNSIIIGAEAGGSAGATSGSYFSGEIQNVVIKNTSSRIGTVRKYLSNDKVVSNHTIYAGWGETTNVVSCSISVSNNTNHIGGIRVKVDGYSPVSGRSTQVGWSNTYGSTNTNTQTVTPVSSTTYTAYVKDPVTGVTNTCSKTITVQQIGKFVSGYCGSGITNYYQPSDVSGYICHYNGTIPVNFNTSCVGYNCAYNTTKYGAVFGSSCTSGISMDLCGQAYQNGIQLCNGKNNPACNKQLSGTYTMFNNTTKNLSCNLNYGIVSSCATNKICSGDVSYNASFSGLTLSSGSTSGTLYNEETKKVTGVIPNSSSESVSMCYAWT